MTIAFISHPDCYLHNMGEDHPESPLRLDAISDQLISSRLEPLLELLDAPLASRDHLALVHGADYIDSVYHTSPVRGLAELDPDTWMNPHTLNAALRAAGAGVMAVDRVMSGRNHAAFCSVRPPGHHAERQRAMGFCIFNNVAIAAAYALQAYALKRVAIVDFDVHHGNGTEDIFYQNPAVMLCSSFQSPFYPYSGVGPLPDHIVNVPLPAGTGSQQFREAIKSKILPALESFRPELLVFSAGFDGHQEDPLAHFRLVEADYSWVTQEIREIAQRHAGGRIVSMLEGGYALHALGRSVVAHLQALI
jgi:acetoin utilization deacetylase AcuC-like enzyme